MDKTIDLEAFFQLVSAGSVDELKELVADSGLEERLKIANTLNSKGESPLIVAIKGNHDKMVEYLVEGLHASICQFGRFIWREFDYGEVAPLYAAVCCDTSGEHPITDFLIGQDLIQNESPALVDLIMACPPTTVSRSDMLKLLGAAYIMSERDSEFLNGPFTGPFEFGLQFWTKAASIRLDDQSANPSTNNSTEYTQKVFESASEFITEDQLQEMFDRPRSAFHFQTQAILIIQRVMGQLQSEPHPYFLLCLIDYGTVWFLEQNLFSRALDVVMLTLKGLQAVNWEDDTNSDWPFTVAEGAFVLLDCCVHLEHRNLPENSFSNLPFSTIMDAFRCFSDFHIRLLKLDDSDASLAIQNNVSLIVRLPQYFNLQETDGEFERWLYGYTNAIKCHPGAFTLLHEVCRLHHKENDAIQLMLKTGSDPEATDEDGKTPLHVLSVVPNEKPFNGVAAKFLLEAGCHLDQRDEEGVRPLDNFTRRLGQENPLDAELNAICKTVLTLKCYCAQVVIRNGLPFKNKIPVTLHPFVEKH